VCSAADYPVAERLMYPLTDREKPLTAAAVCWVQNPIAGQRERMEGMRIHRRTLLAAGLTGMAWTATQRLAAAPNTRIRFIFHVSSTWGDLFDWLVDRGYRPIMAELEKRGFPAMLVHSL
jgi:hypothetical protein